jgi:hypothetical protein
LLTGEHDLAGHLGIFRLHQRRSGTQDDSSQRRTSMMTTSYTVTTV